MSRSIPSAAVGTGSFTRTLPGPVTSASVHATSCIALSGVTKAAPVEDQPAPLKIPISSPRRAASSMVCAKRAHHSSLAYSTGPFGVPSCVFHRVKPPRPMRFMSSRSRVIASRVTCPFIQCHQVCGLY